MEPTADRIESPATHQGTGTPVVPPATIDVPGASATHIGDLYAEEERRQRHERTELMIQRAESIPEA